ncbi:hypothetical protein BB560_001153 [Smittium megazygosporum]|uniref:Inositol-phosphate phosphatase n=1 Tax=Smittium megazygosporum TaxID=133381 RepID=A0A2T9ZIE4_9FUNG|nr:hypothetical protein BB560_001153 [Smittium megazygosporum]
MSDKEVLKVDCLAFAIYMAVCEAGPECFDAFWRKGKYGPGFGIGAIKKQGKHTDCLTVVDPLIENLLLSKISSRYPSHLFIGEETASESSERRTYSNLPTWIIDPIDGTNNFVHRFPSVGISIALSIDNFAEVGVVFLPVLDELYFGSIGNGAYLLENASKVVNSVFSEGFDKTIFTSSPAAVISNLTSVSRKLPLYDLASLEYLDDIDRCSVITEHGTDRNEVSLGKRTRTISRLLSSDPDPLKGGHIESLRIMGCASVDLINVAKGSADIYFESGPHIWDYAAAAVFVLESGGALFSGEGLYGTPEAVPVSSNPDVEPKPFNMWNRTVTAVRAMPNLDNSEGQEIPGSAIKKQKQLAHQLLCLVESIDYEPDGFPPE